MAHVPRRHPNQYCFLYYNNVLFFFLFFNNNFSLFPGWHTSLAVIQITGLRIPSRAALGDRLELECDWKPRRERIYSLKWYFGLDEFYRYTPNATETDPVQVRSGT